MCLQRDPGKPREASRPGLRTEGVQTGPLFKLRTSETQTEAKPDPARSYSKQVSWESRTQNVRNVVDERNVTNILNETNIDRYNAYNDRRRSSVEKDPERRYAPPQPPTEPPPPIPQDEKPRRGSFQNYQYQPPPTLDSPYPHSVTTTSVNNYDRTQIDHDRTWKFRYPVAIREPDAKNIIRTSTDILETEECGTDVPYVRENFIERPQPPPPIKRLGRVWQPPPDGPYDDVRQREPTREWLLIDDKEHKWIGDLPEREFRYEQKQWTPGNSPPPSRRKYPQVIESRGDPGFRPPPTEEEFRWAAPSPTHHERQPQASPNVPPPTEAEWKARAPSPPRDDSHQRQHYKPTAPPTEADFRRDPANPPKPSKSKHRHQVPHPTQVLEHQDLPPPPTPDELPRQPSSQNVNVQMRVIPPQKPSKQVHEAEAQAYFPLPKPEPPPPPEVVPLHASQLPVAVPPKVNIVNRIHKFEKEPPAPLQGQQPQHRQERHHHPQEQQYHQPPGQVIEHPVTVENGTPSLKRREGPIPQAYFGYEPDPVRQQPVYQKQPQPAKQSTRYYDPPGNFSPGTSTWSDDQNLPPPPPHLAYGTALSSKMNGMQSMVSSLLVRFVVSWIIGSKSAAVTILIGCFANFMIAPPF